MTDPEKAKAVHDMDQMLAAMRTIAVSLATLYKELREQGVPSREAASIAATMGVEWVKGSKPPES